MRAEWALSTAPRTPSSIATSPSKSIPDSFAVDPDRLARFTREAQVLASLNHPNIAAIYGVEEQAIVMELVEGQTLAGPIPVNEALPLIHQLIDALEYAHEKGIIHRDLKPANIKITPEGRLKVLDFGLAKAMSNETPAGDPASSPTLTMRATMAGMIMGTAAYMAPEQARGHKVDRRADIWAFGVVVFEMLTGKPLFDAPTVTDTLAAVLTREPDLTAVPERVRPLLRKCLERDPRQRLRDIGDAALLMRETPPAATPPVPRRRVLPILAIAATLAACAFAGLWLRGPAAPLPYRFTLDMAGPILFSPNGRWMVSAAGGLRVRSVQDVKWQLLPGADLAMAPFWSPDSSTIGFFAGGRLRAIGIDGSGPQNLAAAPEPRGGSWRGGVADGIILFASAGKLQTLDLHSGKVSQLALRFSEGKVPALPVFCPEGDGFVYLVAAGRASALFRSSLSSREMSGVHVLDTVYGTAFARHPRSGRWQIFFVRGIAGVVNRSLMTAPIDPRTGALAGDTVRVLDALSNWAGTDYAGFDVASGGMIYWRTTTPALPIWRLRWFDRNGNVTGTVGDPAGYSSISLSPDDSRVATVQGFPDQQVWIHNLQNGTGARLSAQASGDGIVWSPEGGSVYFTSLTDSGSRVMRQSADPGSSPELVYADATNRTLMVQAITPDGRYLVLAQFVDPSASTLVRLDLSAPPETRKPDVLIPESSIFGQFNLRISPDGRSLIVIARGIVYASPFPPVGNSLRQVAAFPAAAWPFFSRDGRTLYVISGQALYSHPVIAAQGGGLRLGERSLLFGLIHPQRTYANLAAASRDGSRLLALATDSVEETRVQVLTDWTTLLKP